MIKFVKKSYFIFVVTFSLMLLLGCKQNTENSAKNIEEVVNIDKKLGPLTISAFISNSESPFKFFEQGAQLGVLGNSSSTINLNFFDPKQGNQDSLKKIITETNSPLILYWSVEELSPIASSLNTLNTVGMVAGEVNNKIIPLGANAYGFGFSTELTFEQMAKFSGNILKSYRFAVITGNEPKFALQSKIFIEESKSLGNTIVFEEKSLPNDIDFNSLISRAKKETCDTIFAVMSADALVKLIKAARVEQFKGKIIVGDNLFASDLAALGQDAEGVYFTQLWSEDKELQTAYLNKYGNKIDGISLGFAALGYDLVHCLQGIAPPFDAYTIKNYLLSTSCEGLTGKTQFTGERVAQRAKKILTINKGQVVIAK